MSPSREMSPPQVPDADTAAPRGGPERPAAQGAETGARGAEHWVILALGLLSPVLLILLGVLLRPDPSGVGTHEQLGLRPCAPMELWDVPCPGCGVTTSVTLTVQGRPLAALANQPLGLLVALLMAVFPIWALAVHLRGRSLGEALARIAVGRSMAILAVFVALTWVYTILLVRYG